MKIENRSQETKKAVMRNAQNAYQYSLSHLERIWSRRYTILSIFFYYQYFRRIANKSLPYFLFRLDSSTYIAEKGVDQVPF